MVLLRHWLVLLWAPPQSEQLAVVKDRPLVGPAQTLVGAAVGPSPKRATVTCQRTTVSGPAQTLVGAAVGPSPKRATVTCQRATVSGPAQTLVGAAVGPSPKLATVKSGR